MIEAAFEFPTEARARVADSVLRLSYDLRPTRLKVEEGNSACVVPRPDALEALLSAGTSVLLEAPSGTFDITAAKHGSIEVRCFLDVAPRAIEALFTHMTVSLPVFAFACDPAERERRNLVKTQLGQSTFETWVGRDTERYIPGLYWLTLLSAELANRHRVPLPALRRVAESHAELAGGLHLLRFYDQPAAWEGSEIIAKVISSTPGLFHVDAAQSDLQQADTFTDLQRRARNWP